MTYRFDIELRDETGRDVETITVSVTADEDAYYVAYNRAVYRAIDLVAAAPEATDYRMYCLNGPEASI